MNNMNLNYLYIIIMHTCLYKYYKLISTTNYNYEDEIAWINRLSINIH